MDLENLGPVPPRLLNEGVHGSVYAVTWNDTDVAVKVIPERMLEVGSQERRFRQKLLKMTEARHPNLVHLHKGVHVPTVGVYFIAELIERDLKSAITSNMNLSTFDKLRWARDLAAGLSYLHN